MFFFIRAIAAYPRIPLGNREFPQAPDSVCRQSLAVNPSVNRIACHAQMLDELFDGYPRLSHRVNEHCCGYLHNFGSQSNPKQATCQA